jgi:hypothetical protein
LDPEVKKKLKEQLLEERFEFERNETRSGGNNGYEIIFPSRYDSELNEKYEMLL